MEGMMAGSNPQESEYAKDETPLRAISDTPAFSLVVYVTECEEEIEVRAANLSGFSCRAGDERAALQKLLPLVKQRVSECLAKQEPIAWLDPPLERQADEQQRVIPFHL